ncbi:MAG: pyridoxamine 5'-phosphate oxidase family protein [Deltaproteobacteria bacterium]|nr:pyridoxamine 5'-phosphate oxidase family protein [Deltaproteobacteria bacterium]
MKKYFEENTGFGVLSTADKDGRVNAAVFARPHCFNDGTIGFVMPNNRLTYSNLQCNDYANYLFRQDPKEDRYRYNGMRLYLKKVNEEDDQERITKMLGRVYGDYLEGRRLLIFTIEKQVPLISNKS